MSYKFKYHPDGWIMRNEGAFITTKSEFMIANPGFPLTTGQFFEYKEDGTFELIQQANGTYSHFPQENLVPYQSLINAINELE